MSNQTQTKTQTKNQQNGGFKRGFPKIKTCFPCCCFELGTALSIVTILLILYDLFLLVSPLIPYGEEVNENNVEEENNFNKYYSIISNIIDLIILVSLCIGLFTKKLSFFKPFELVYGLLLLLGLLSGLIMMLLGSASSIGAIVSGEDQSGDSVVGIILLTLFYIFFYGLLVYYYLAVLSYKEDIKEDLYFIEQQRAMEGNVPQQNTTTTV